MSDLLLTRDIAGRQSQPMLAYGPDGSFVATWVTWEGDDSSAVRAQRFDASGAPVGEVIEVSGFGAEILRAWGPKADVAVAADGSFVIAWREGREDASTGLLRRFNADGTPAGAVVTFADSITDYRGEPSLAMRADGSFVVAFTQTLGSSPTVQTRAFDASGTPVGGPAAPVAIGTNPSMAMAADGSHVVVWDTRFSGGGGDGGSFGVFGQRFAADGTAQGPVFGVNATTAGEQQVARVAMDAAGNTVIVWESNHLGRTVDQDGSTVAQFDIFAQRYDATGAAVGGEFRVNSLAAGDHAMASVAIDPAGGFLIAWASDGQDGSRLGVYARRYDANGVPEGAEFRVNLDPLGAQHRPVVEFAPDGGFVIAWDSGGGLGDSRDIGPDTELGGDGSQAGVYLRRFLPDGTPAPVVLLDLDTASAGAGREVIVVPGAPAALGKGVAIEAAGIPLLDGATARLEARPDGTAETLALDAAAAAAAGAAGIAVAWDAATGVLTLSGSATVDAYQTVLEGVTYANAAGIPTAGDRVVAVQVTAPGGLQSQVARATFTEWDGTPALTLDLDAAAPGTGSLATGLREDGPAPLFAGDVVIGTLGLEVLTGATVQLGARQNGAAETLSLTAAAAAAASAAGITATWNAASGLMTFTGEASAAAYEAALEGLRFTNVIGTSNITSFHTGTRTLAVEVSGPGSASATAMGTLLIDRHASADLTVATTSVQQTNWPALAYHRDGTWIAVWNSNGSDGSADGIYLQRMDSTGQALSPPVRVNTETDGAQTVPDLAVAADGSFVVVWQSADQDGDRAGIFAQRFDRNGAPVGAEFQVNVTTTGNQSVPSVAMDASGRFTIAWASTPGDSNAADVMARRFSADGAPETDEFVIGGAADGRQQTPAVAMAPDGRSVMVWADGLSTDVNILAQRYDATGAALGSPVLVNTTTAGNQSAPSVAMDAAGNFVVAWTSNQTTDTNIYAQRFDAAGQPLGEEFRANSVTPGSQSSAQVAMGPDGGFLIIWQSAMVGDRGTGTYGQRYDAAGARIGGEFRLTGLTEDGPGRTGTAFAPDGGFATVYASGGGSDALHAAFFHADGTLTHIDLDGSAPGTGFATTFTAGGAPVGIADSDAVLNPLIASGITGFSHATATLTRRTDGMAEFLTLDAHPSGILAEWDEATGTLTLQGPGSGSEFLAALQAIRYLNTDPTPTEGDRSVAVQFFGAPSVTPVVTATITVAEVETAPSGITLAGGTVLENMAGAEIGALTVTDPDPGDTHAFTVSDFRFEVVDGVLRLRPGVALDYEAAPEVALQVTATDSDGLSVTETLRIAVGNLDETIRGTAGADTLRGAEKLLGHGGDDVLFGGHGTDRLDGGTGADVMVGGTGNDIYLVDDAGDVVVELPGEGLDRVISSSSHTIAPHVENLSLSGTAATGRGNALDNRIIGNAAGNVLVGLEGNDRLDGRGGADVMLGGTGNDTYFVDGAGDVVVELPGEGVDRVVSSISYVLGAEVENLRLFGTAAIDGTGNAFGNSLLGNDAANRLFGLGGNDRLMGRAGADRLDGGEGNDVLDGGAGADFLQGGAGNDIFRFVAGEASSDQVADFDGRGATAGDRLVFVGYGTVAEGANFMRVSPDSWLVASADGTVQDVIRFIGAPSIHASDWVFV